MGVRSVLLLLILVLGLTLINAVYTRNEHDHSLTNPYGGPSSVFGSVVGAAVVRPQSDDSKNDFLLREAAIVIAGVVAFLMLRRLSPSQKQG
ncbi:MAG: hypothetical protein M3Z14_04740 [Candidatus Eremiobacteraeota bacterium]|nr:hypothetical protein [Candidatus Eremiobacteraeota bacterium]